MSCSGNHDIRAAADSGKVARMGMAHRDGRVARREHGSDRASDHERTPHDDNVGAIELNNVMVEQLNHRFRRAGGIARTRTCKRGQKR